MKLLIVEDETNIAVPLKRVLEQHGYAVDYAADGAKGLFFASHNDYDCIILDLNLPQVSGLEVLKQLRGQANAVPTIMLTAKSQVYDKVEGFSVGADDYVTKPFHLDELMARIKAVIKRSSDNKVVTLQFGLYTLFPDKNLVVKTGQSKPLEITLTSKETAILEYLLRHPDRIISAEELLEHVWDNEVNLFTDTVKTHLKTLRQKIDPRKTLIITVRGKGYQIIHV